jgi:hypothetical protein
VTGAVASLDGVFVVGGCPAGSCVSLAVSQPELQAAATEITTNAKNELVFTRLL